MKLSIVEAPNVVTASKSCGPTDKIPYPVFLFSDYREFLRTYCEYFSSHRGIRTRLAEAAHCKPSYFSLVLQREAELSLDQIYGVAQFISLSEVEWEYLKDLWLFCRAGNAQLKKEIETRLSTQRDHHFGPAGGTSALNVDKRDHYAKFLKSWKHTAVYVALEIFSCDSAPEISKQLELTLAEVKGILSELEEMGLAHCKSGAWKQTTNSFVMDRLSPTYQTHRMLWFSRSFERFLTNPEHGYHGGVCFAASETQFAELKKRIQETIFDILKSADTAKTVPGKKVTYLNIDLFEV